VLGRYGLQKPLGTGGFGTVWLARDERLERDVAVKVLPRSRVNSGRFEREARAAARLSHPAIVTLYEAAVDDDAAYLVSELVRGATLADLLEAGRLSDRDIVTIGIALCDALEHAHAQGVVHRDVKPSNVLVPDHPPSPAQVAKLTDFGVARLIGKDGLTRTGDVVGTDAYMAPEQAEGREAAATADLYSLALVLYEALTGVNPIAIGTAPGRGRRLGAHLPPVRRHRRDLPQELGRSIDLALRPRADERGTVAGLRAGLTATLTEVADRPGVVESPWPRRARASTQPWAQSYGAGRATPPASQAPPPADHAEVPAPPLRWPARGLAAGSAAVIAAWLAAAVASSAPVTPATAALLAALLVGALPRLGWLAFVVAAAIALAAHGQSGAALLVLAGALVPVVLIPRAPTRWPLGAAAPVLGALSLAGAWPALAALDRHAWRRGALGAVGWIWVAAAGLLTGRGVYTTLPPGIPPKAVWIGSLDQTTGRALGPLLGSGLLLGAVIWAGAAIVLPWIARGPAAVQLVVIVMWSAALASATTTVLQGLHSGVAPRPGAAVLGAVAGAVLAIVSMLIKRARRAPGSANTAAGLA
jgi:eukaryotic-like serine/threonine-protein kinase